MANADIAKRLRMLRESKGMTLQEIADILGIPKTTYASYEQAKSEPNISMIVKIVEYYGISVDWLLGVGEYAKSPPPESRWKALQDVLESLPEQEVKDLMLYLDFLKWRYQNRRKSQ